MASNSSTMLSGRFGKKLIPIDAQLEPGSEGFVQVIEKVTLPASQRLILYELI